MLRNSEGCVLPSYFSGTSGLKFFVLGHWTRRSSRVNAGQPAAYGKSPGSPGARASTASPALWSDCRRVSRRRSILVRASSCCRSSRISVQSQAKPLASDKVALLGDLVLRHVQSAKNYNKLTPKQEGPYRVRQVVRPGAVRLKTEEGLPVSNSWDIEHLRKFRP